MKVPSPGESITEVEIAEWLVEDGDYVEKDQAIAEVDSDKATLELPAEQSGTITLKAEVGDAVEVGAVVCLIDTAAAKPEGGESTETEEKKEAPKAEVKKEEPVAKESYATGTASPAAKKILEEKAPSDQLIPWGGGGEGAAAVALLAEFRSPENEAILKEMLKDSTEEWARKDFKRTKDGYDITKTNGRHRDNRPIDSLRNRVKHTFILPGGFLNLIHHRSRDGNDDQDRI